MRIETLEEFIVFAKHQNFSKAAQEMFISQPTLSMHMSNLEKEVGFKLIKRGSQAALTPAGLIFLGRCQEIVDLYYRALYEGQKVAATLPPARILDNERSFELHRLAALVKGVPYSLVGAPENMSLSQAVEKDIADLGLVIDYNNFPDIKEKAEASGFVSFPVGVARLIICMMKDHPLAAKKSLTKADLYEYPIVISSSTYYREWQRIITDLVKPDKPLSFKLDPLENTSNLSFIDFGTGIHFYLFDIQRVFLGDRDDIVTFDELDGKPIEATSVIAYNSRSQNENVTLFAERLREITSDPAYPGLPDFLIDP